MAKTKIEWSEKVWNPVVGCSRISPGCDNCYAEKMHRRLNAMGLEKYKEPFNVVRLHKPSLSIPSKTKKPTVFFVNSMSDLFHEDMKIEWIAEAWKQMARNPRHIFLILTKRPEKLLFLSWLQDEAENGEIPSVPDNIWLGVTVESSKYLHRIETLGKIPAKHKFISFEPLLDEVKLIDKSLEGIDWVIVGGENGNNARPINRNSIRDIFYKCQKFNIPFFFKQVGAAFFNTFHYNFGHTCEEKDILKTKQFPPEIQKLMEGKKK